MKFLDNWFLSHGRQIQSQGSWQKWCVVLGYNADFDGGRVRLLVVVCATLLFGNHCTGVTTLVKAAACAQSPR